MKHAQTAAPLMSLIIRTVYNECGYDFETGHHIGMDDKKISLTDVKSICCFIAFDIISGHRSKDISKCLGFGDGTFETRKGQMINKMHVDGLMHKRVKELKRLIISQAITQYKYSSFLNRSAKNF